MSDEEDVSVGGAYLKAAQLKFDQLQPGMEVCYAGGRYKVDKIDPGGYVQFIAANRAVVVLFKTQIDSGDTSIISIEDAIKLGILKEQP